MNRKVTPEQVAELAKTMYAAEIGRELGVSRERVRQILKKLGIEAQPMPEPVTAFCSVCGKPSSARGLCPAHYYHLRAWGDPLASAPPHEPSICEECGKDCSQREGLRKTAGRYIGADGKKRCAACHTRFDSDFRERKRERERDYQPRWKAGRRLAKLYREVV